MSGLLQPTARPLDRLARIKTGREPARVIWQAIAWRAVLSLELAALYAIVPAAHRRDLAPLLVTLAVEVALRVLSLLPGAVSLRGWAYRDDRDLGFEARRWAAMIGIQAVLIWCFAIRDLPPLWVVGAVLAVALVAGFVAEAVIRPMRRNGKVV